MLAFVSLDKLFNRHEPDSAEERKASRVMVVIAASMLNL